MSIYVSGSMAFDRIMSFGGHFQDNIIQDKIHTLSISFMVDRMEEKMGGCAGNIAYTLALLGEAPIVLSSAGRDFAPYAAHMQRMGLPLDGIYQDDELFTALCYITTDLSNNQITGFYPGAMSLPCKYGFPNIQVNKDIALISPGNLLDMRSLPEYFKNQGVRYIFDPGQQLPVISAEELLKAINGSYILVSNDYELEMICQKTGKTQAEIEALTEYCITTLGEKGSTIMHKGQRTEIAAIAVKNVVDPTGAGDAHRAGLLKGLYQGLSMVEAASLGATTASFAIEHYGTQIHSFTKEEFWARHTTMFAMPATPIW